MKSIEKIALGIFLVVSLACGGTITFGNGNSQPTRLPSTPTLIPLPTKTPLPNIVIQVETAQLDASQMVLMGQLFGVPADTVHQSVLNITLYDFYKQSLLEQQFPCADPPHTADAICAFNFSFQNPPAGVVDFEIEAQIFTRNGLILEGWAGSSSDYHEAPVVIVEEDSSPGFSPERFLPEPPVIQDEYVLSAMFSSSDFYIPENGSYLHVYPAYLGNIEDLDIPTMDLCASIIERRQYESGQTSQTVLTEECQTVNFTDKSMNNEFFFKPSGYGFVWIDSPDGRYKISEIAASVTLTQNQQPLFSTSALHIPIPVRVTSGSVSDRWANAVVEVMAGQNQDQIISLLVYQKEFDPDEVFWNRYLFFIPCIVPDICDDRSLAGKISQKITLAAGTSSEISTWYTIVPVKEEGNTIIGYKTAVYFEGIFIGSP